MKPTSINLTDGAGGQALGVAAAGFEHLAVITSDPFSRMTIKMNRPHWPVYNQDIASIDFTKVCGQVDLFSASLTPPFYNEPDNCRLGASPLPAVCELIAMIQPRAIMLDIAPSFFHVSHDAPRVAFLRGIEQLG